MSIRALPASHARGGNGNAIAWIERLFIELLYEHYCSHSVLLQYFTKILEAGSRNDLHPLSNQSAPATCCCAIPTPTIQLASRIPSTGSTASSIADQTLQAPGQHDSSTISPPWPTDLEARDLLCLARMAVVHKSAQSQSQPLHIAIAIAILD